MKFLFVQIQDFQEQRVSHVVRIVKPYKAFVICDFELFTVNKIDLTNLTTVT